MGIVVAVIARAAWGRVGDEPAGLENRGCVCHVEAERSGGMP